MITDRTLNINRSGVVNQNKESPDFSPSMIWQARKRIRNHVFRTPLIFSHALSKITGNKIYLKMESWQITGSFKVRGAVNMVSALTKEERAKGLVTASSGNHGTALSYAASIFENPPTRVYLPKTATLKK